MMITILKESISFYMNSENAEVKQKIYIQLMKRLLMAPFSIKIVFTLYFKIKSFYLWRQFLTFAFPAFLAFTFGCQRFSNKTFFFGFDKFSYFRADFFN